MARLIFTTALLILPAIFGLLMPLCIAENILYKGDILSAGQSLTLGDYSLTLGDDCNLVLHDPENILWDSETSGRGPGCSLRFLPAGNLVIYDMNLSRVWQSNTGNVIGNYVLILQRNGIVAIYGPQLWSAGTKNGGVGVTITKHSTKSSTSESLNLVGGASDQNIAMVTN